MLNDIENALAKTVGLVELAVGGRIYKVVPYESCVDEGILWRGSVRDAAGLQQLAAQGFRRIVNLCAEHDESDAVHAAGMYAQWLPIIDNTPPTMSDVEQFLDGVGTGRPSPVYVHCEAGKGRTGCLVAAYRVLRQGWTPERALHEAERFGLAVPAQRAFILSLGPRVR